MSKPNPNLFLKTILLLLILSISHLIGLAQDARLIAKNIFPSVVLLEMRDDKNRPISLGSGFFVRPDVVVTNYHVIEGASDGFAKVVGKTSIYHIEGVVGFDKKKDLALLKLKGVIGKPLILADISKIEVGQEVFALGNPKGLEGTISTGIISGSTLRKVGNENLIQITAPISPGSSGGPVVNRKGEVIGVAVASLTGGQNLNFAVPSSYLALLLTNSKEISPLSSVKREINEDPSSNTESSVAEITVWLTEKLTAKGGLKNYQFTETIDKSFRRNERLVFDKCTMSSVESTKYSSDYQVNITSIVQLNTFEDVFFDGVDESSNDNEKNTVFVTFIHDDALVKVDEFEKGRLVKSYNDRHKAVQLWVGDQEMGLRVIRAFKQLGKLCKERTKGEPF